MNYKKIVFATNNKNKLAEIREMLAGTGINVLSLGDINCHADIPETAPTIEGNAPTYPKQPPPLKATPCKRRNTFTTTTA